MNTLPRPAAHSGRLLFSAIFVIALAGAVAFSGASAQSHTLGHDPYLDSGQMPIKGNGPGTPSSRDITFAWADQFDDGDLQGWNVFCTGSLGASIGLVLDDPMARDSWCLRGHSSNRNRACGFVAQSPDLNKAGLDFQAPYRIRFSYQIPAMKTHWTYTLMDRSLILVVDRTYVDAGFAVFGYSPTGSVGDFRWLGNLDLNRWYNVEVRIRPEADRSWFTVLLDGAPLGSGSVPVRARHGYRLVLQDARFESERGFTYGGGLWDNFLVLGQRRAVAPAAPRGEDIQVRQVGANPFNPATVVMFDLPRAQRVRLEIFDGAGRRVTELCDRVHERGEHRYVWRGTDRAGRTMASGVYHARLVAGDVVKTMRLTLVR